MEDKEQNLPREIEEPRRPTFSIEEEDEEEFVYKVPPTSSEEEEVEKGKESGEQEPDDKEIDEEDFLKMLNQHKKEKEPKKRKEPKEKKPFHVGKVILPIAIIVLLILIFLVAKAILTREEGSGTEATFSSGENVSVEKALELTEMASEKSENLNSINALPSVPSTETTEETEALPHFTDKSLGIDFLYPREWVELGQFQTKPTASSVKNVIMVGYPVDSNVMENMRISIEETPTSITSKEYFKETEGRMKEIFPKFQSVDSGEITVSGREAPTRTYLWVPQSEIDRTEFHQEWTRLKQYQVYVAGKRKVYLVTFTADEDSFNKNVSKYQEVLKGLQLGE